MTRASDDDVEQYEHPVPLTKRDELGTMRGIGIYIGILLLVLTIVTGCEKNTFNDDGMLESSTLKVALSAGGGREIIVAHWTISHPNGYSREGEIHVADPASELSAYIGGIPAGSGYLIRMTAETTDGASCMSETLFDILPGESTFVTLTLHCRIESGGSIILDAEANMCPTIDFLIAAPTTQGLGKKIALEAGASDGDDSGMLSYAWSAAPASINRFDNASLDITNFQCNTGGTYTLTLTVTDGDTSSPNTCAVSKEIAVTCLFSNVFDALNQGSVLLGRPTDSSITLNVVSDLYHLAPEVSFELYFEYGRAPEALHEHTLPVEPEADNPVVVTIDDLSPNTQYYYRMRYRPVNDNNAEWLATKVRSFHTQRSPGERFAFTVQADAHLYHDLVPWSVPTYENTIANVIADTPDFHFDLGDTFVNEGLNPVCASLSEDDIFSKVLGCGIDGVYETYLLQRRYLGRIGRFAPVFLVIGNHEDEEGWNLDDMGEIHRSMPMMNQNARKRYFLNPVQDDFYSSAPDYYDAIVGDHLRDAFYSFHWGDALFVALDPFWYTTVKPFDLSIGGEQGDEEVIGDRWSWTLGKMQYDWLKETLENSTATFKFIFIHHLIGGSTVSGAGYGRGGASVAGYFEWGGKNADGSSGFSDKRPVEEGWSAPIHQLLVENGVTIVFHGHDHLFA
jgi:hypothetical protein